MANHASVERQAEVWRPVPGYEGEYEVSDRGRVRNSRTGHVKKTWLAGAGYVQVGLRASIRAYPHRLVACAFLGSPCGREVNHKNGIKTDNRVSNLEWVTKSEQHLHRACVLGKGRGKDCGAKLSERAVPRIRSMLASGVSLREVARKFGVSHSAILRIKSGKTWSYVA